MGIVAEQDLGIVGVLQDDIAQDVHADAHELGSAGGEGEQVLEQTLAHESICHLQVLLADDVANEDQGRL